MSQPIRHFHDDPSVDFGPEAFVLYPTLAVLLARVTSAWAAVETTIDFAFIMLVGSGSETSIAMYRALTGNGPKEHAVNAAAQEKLVDEDFRLFLAARKALKRVGKQRNAVVHGLVGHSPQIRDALVIIRQDDLFENLNDLFRKQHLSPDPASVKQIAADRFVSRACVYKEGDLKKVIQRCEWADQIARDLAIICAEVHPMHERARLRLSGEPLIQRELRRLNR
jgi:hypothetical protein